LFFGDTPVAKNIKENMLPFSKLCPPEIANDFLRRLGLAHMDAHLKKNLDAVGWLDGDIKAYMADQGVDVRVVKESEILV